MNIEAILDSLEPITESGCLVWTRTQNDKGYGRVSFNGKVKMTHRVVYEHFHGPIPEGMQLDHLCRVRCCANVNHLEVVSLKENVLRGLGPPARNARKTECKNGHVLTNDNVKIRRNGRRACKECMRTLSRRKYYTYGKAWRANKRKRAAS